MARPIRETPILYGKAKMKLKRIKTMKTLSHSIAVMPTRMAFFL